jgi:transposase
MVQAVRHEALTPAIDVIAIVPECRLDGGIRRAVVDAIPPLQGERGRPRCRPDCVLGDRAYDAETIRDGLRARHIHPLLAVRRTRHGSGLGRWRWVVERTFAWLNQFRRLRVRYDKRTDIHEALLSLACALICWQSLRKDWIIG